ncbi:MAG: NUDIX domain-containing protein [Clostridia bacterium]|nr:NUDIX domain-containing protein [Clostridia bacterium]
MSVEIWDILNSKAVPTGKTVVRGQGFLKPGEYHLVVHIWIISSVGKFLIQRRSDERKLMPGEWAATGGSAISGETSFEAAKRELSEELGIRSNKHNLFKLIRLKRKNSFLDVWVITVDLPSEKLVLQKSEVKEVKWVTKDTLLQMIENGEYHNYGDEYFDNVFEKLDDYRGTFV